MKTPLLEPQDTLDMVAQAVFGSSQAWSTGYQRALRVYFVPSHGQYYLPVQEGGLRKWQLDEWAPTLVSSVVESY